VKTTELQSLERYANVHRMRALSAALTLLVAALHLWFLVLEMFLWTSPLGMAAFQTSRQYAERSAVLAAHQGLYNGFIAAGLLYGLFGKNDAFRIFFLGAAVTAGVFGGFTIGPVPLVIQALPALGALSAVLIARASAAPASS